MGCQIDMEWKGCESIGCMTHLVTLNYDLTHDLDPWFSRSNFEKVITQERDARSTWNERDVGPTLWLSTLITHDLPQSNTTLTSYSVAERYIPARCAALLQHWQLCLQRCKRYTKSCVWQRYATLWTVYNVAQCYGMLSRRCQTLSNVVVSKLCNVSSCKTLPLSNAVQRCYNDAKRYKTLCNVVTTLSSVIQHCATLLQCCQTLYNAVQQTTLPNVIQRCATLTNIV